MNKDSDLLSRLVRVEVLGNPVIPGRSGVKNGNPWTIPPAQLCAIWQDSPFPVQLEIPVPESGPYKPGVYLLTGEPLAPHAVNDRSGTARIRVNFSDRNVELVSIEEVAAYFAKAPKLAVAS